MKGYHQDGDLRKQLENLPCNVHTVKIGHLVIEENQVGWSIQHLVQGFGAGSRLTAYVPGFLLLQNSPRQLAAERLFSALGRFGDVIGDYGQDYFLAG